MEHQGNSVFWPNPFNDQQHQGAENNRGTQQNSQTSLKKVSKKLLSMHAKGVGDFKKVLDKSGYLISRVGSTMNSLLEDIRLQRLPLKGDVPEIDILNFPRLSSTTRRELVQEINNSEVILSECQNKIHVSEKQDLPYLARIAVRVLDINHPLLMPNYPENEPEIFLLPRVVDYMQTNIPEVSTLNKKNTLSSRFFSSQLRPIQNQNLVRNNQDSSEMEIIQENEQISNSYSQNQVYQEQEEEEEEKRQTGTPEIEPSRNFSIRRTRGRNISVQNEIEDENPNDYRGCSICYIWNKNVRYCFSCGGPLHQSCLMRSFTIENQTKKCPLCRVEECHLEESPQNNEQMYN